MLNKNQGQNVAEGSTAIQAGGNVVVGLSYSEARQVALDVFRANFVELIGAAKETAAFRATEITEDFLVKLQKEYPAGIEKAKDPDFQHALFTVQTEYAKHGDKDLGSLLVDLLVDRSKQKPRDILQIVLNESLSTAPKLTDNQLAVLSMVFFFKYTQNHGIINHQMLGEYFDKYAAPFVGKAIKNTSCYQHLEFSGCGSVGLGENRLENIMGRSYQGCFMKGFDEKEIYKKDVASGGITLGGSSKFFIQCLNDGSRKQVRAVNREHLDKSLQEYFMTSEEKENIVKLFDVGRMNDSEVRSKCIEIRPYMSVLFDVWSDSPMKNFTLTSVGIAIGHANIKRLTGEFANLSIWIN